MRHFPAVFRVQPDHDAMRLLSQRPELRYGSFILVKGDNDARRIWGGVRHAPDPATDTAFSAPLPVAALQSDLAAIGVYTLKIDGAFGGGTEAALKLFQWNAKHVPFRLKGGRTQLVSVAQRTFSDDPSGVLNPKTVFELSAWLNSGYAATGDLVRMAISVLPNSELGSGFKRIVNPSVMVSDLVMSKALVEDIKAMDKKAGELGVTLSINQVMRMEGVRVTGTAAKPAGKSQHKIGHAIDVNIRDGSSFNNKPDFNAGNETQNAKDFIKAMKSRGMRWGGDFAAKGTPKFDPPHFDRQSPAQQEAYDFKFFFNQRMVTEGHVIPEQKG